MNNKGIHMEPTKHYIKLEHIATTIPQFVPITTQEYKRLSDNDNEDLVDNILITQMGAGWFKDYFYEGVV